jgi:hypothetical protein
MLNYHLTAELARYRQAELLAEANRERLARTVHRHRAAPPTRRVRHLATIAGWLLGVAAPVVLLVLETSGTRIP